MGAASVKWTLAFDLLILLICLPGIYQMYRKTDLPLSMKTYRSEITVSNAENAPEGIKKGDIIKAVQNIPVSSREEIEVILDETDPSSSVHVDLKRGSLEFSSEVKPVRFYSFFYIAAAFFIGLFFIATAVVVLLKASDKKTAFLFNWASVGTSAIIMTTWSNNSVLPFEASLTLKTLFNLAYAFVPAGFVHFTLSFPEKHFKNLRRLLPVLYTISAVLFISTTVFFLLFHFNRSLSFLDAFLLIFNFNRAYLILCVAAAIAFCIASYRAAQTVHERKKLKWILLSFVIGPGSFVALWVIPQALTTYALIPEEVMLLLMTAIPIGFAIAIVRYHVFDIDQLIRRSFIYSVAIGTVVVMYVIFVYLITNIFQNIDKSVPSVFVAAVIALLFHPVKKRVQEYTDKKFFKVSYDFRTASRKILEKVRNSGDISSLALNAAGELDRLIPVEKTGFFVFNESGTMLKLLFQKNLSQKDSFLIKREKLEEIFTSPSGNLSLIEPEVNITALFPALISKYGIALAIPLKSTSNSLLGFIVMGRKFSGGFFTIEDVDLCNEVALEAAVCIERFQLYESLIRKQMEEERLKELNQLKSFFISSVSHDLKTPITSIRMFTELLQGIKDYSPEETMGYLDIIQGECQRLTRLIDNVLDLSKIERGVKEYHFSEADLEELVRYSLDIMAYQFKIENCSLNVKMYGGVSLIYADSDSIISAIVNLLSNALKYSVHPKELYISVEKEDRSVLLKVHNNGPGIDASEISHLGELYFRSKDSQDRNIPGTGLGLYLVHQIIKAHGGRLEVTSPPDGGCMFTVILPLRRDNAEDFNSRR